MNFEVTFFTGKSIYFISLKYFLFPFTYYFNLYL